MSFFLVDEVGWDDEDRGARRKFLAQGEGGFHSQYSELPSGYTIAAHSHDRDELIVVLRGSCTLLDGGPTLQARDSMVLAAGDEYGFAAGPDGMAFLTIRTAPARVTFS